MDNIKYPYNSEPIINQIFPENTQEEISPQNKTIIGLFKQNIKIQERLEAGRPKLEAHIKFLEKHLEKIPTKERDSIEKAQPLSRWERFLSFFGMKIKKQPLVVYLGITTEDAKGYWQAKITSINTNKNKIIEEKEKAINENWKEIDQQVDNLMKETVENEDGPKINSLFDLDKECSQYLDPIDKRLEEIQEDLLLPSANITELKKEQNELLQKRDSDFTKKIRSLRAKLAPVIQKFGWQKALESIQGKQSDQLENILKKLSPEAINRQDERGNTLLWHAANLGNEEALRLLLKSGAEESRLIKGEDGKSAHELMREHGLDNILLESDFLTKPQPEKAKVERSETGAQAPETLPPAVLINLKWLAGSKGELRSEDQEALQMFIGLQSPKEVLTLSEWSNLAKAHVLLNAAGTEEAKKLVIRYLLANPEHLSDGHIHLPVEFSQLLSLQQKGEVAELLRYHDLVSSHKTGITQKDLSNKKKEIETLKRLPQSNKKVEERVFSKILKVSTTPTNKLNSICQILAQEINWQEVPKHDLSEVRKFITDLGTEGQAQPGVSAAIKLFEQLAELHELKKAIPLVSLTFSEIRKNLAEQPLALTPIEASRLLRSFEKVSRDPKFTFTSKEWQKMNELAASLNMAVDLQGKKMIPVDNEMRKYAARISNSYQKYKIMVAKEQKQKFIETPLNSLEKPQIIKEPQALWQRELGHVFANKAQELQLDTPQKISAKSIAMSENFTPPTSPKDAQEKANNLENRLKKNLASALGCKPDEISLKAVADLIRRGETPENIKERFEDGGIALLRDYVYPYVIYENLAQATPENFAKQIIIEPASAQVLAKLLEKDSSLDVRQEQVSLLCNLIMSMNREGGEILRGSFVRNNQVKMLQKCTDAIMGNKPVVMQAPPGSGKSTMVRLFGKAFPINADVPFIVHVAPFAQTDPTWKAVSEWKDFENLGEPPIHVCIKANELQRLLNGGEISPDILKNLNKSLFVMDEFDHPDYGDIQKKLMGQGCKRFVNISATGSMQEMTNGIQHLKAKMDGINQILQDADRLPPAERQTLEKQGVINIEELNRKKANYQNKIAEKENYLKTLQEKMQAEWGRNIDFQSIDSGADQIEKSALDNIIGQVAKDQSADRFLVQMPAKRLQEEDPFILEIEERLVKEKTPAVILYRETLEDGSGQLVARAFSIKTNQWESKPFEDFRKEYDGMTSSKPKIVCLYTEDCVGGDFEEFSRVGVGTHGKQFLVFQNDIIGTQQVYQFLSRLRRPETTEVGQLPPVSIYLGKQLHERLAKQYQEGIKQGFLTEANIKTQGLELQAEQVRLQAKIQTKLGASLKKLLDFRINSWIETIVKETGLQPNDPWIKKIRQELSRLSTQKFNAMKNEIGETSDLNKLADQLIAGIRKDFNIPSFTSDNAQLRDEIIMAQAIRNLGKYFKNTSLTQGLEKLREKFNEQVGEKPNEFMDVWARFLSTENQVKITTGMAENVLNSLRKTIKSPKPWERTLTENQIGDAMESWEKNENRDANWLKILTAYDLPNPPKGTLQLTAFSEALKTFNKEIATKKVLKQVINQPAPTIQSDVAEKWILKEMNARIDSYKKLLGEVNSKYAEWQEANEGPKTIHIHNS